MINFFESIFCGKVKVELQECKDDNASLTAEIEGLHEQLTHTFVDQEAYWNEKWPRGRIEYSTKPGENIDIRSAFNVDWKDEHDMRRVTRSWEKLTPDEIAMKALDYVIKRVKYESDNKLHNTPEYWQSAGETYDNRTGDCEDGAILLLKLMQFAGVPNWRLKLCAGWVRANENAPQGGHAYAIYLADDDKWYALDWCYYPSVAKKSFKVKPHSELDYYEDIWWTTNSQFTWIQKDFKIEEELK